MTLSTPSGLERLSRAAVLLSVFVGIIFEAWLGAFEWRPLLPATCGAFIGAIVLARKSPTLAWAVSLGTAYVVPVIFQATLGRFQLAYQTIWLAALFGTVVVRTDWTRWMFPPLWKLPLAYWALAIALVWPIIVARETDFRWDTMLVGNTANSGLGGPPNVVAVMILNVSLTHLLGLLCFDSFFAAFPTIDNARFRRVILAPLAVSFVIGAGVALYQGLVDISWLSAHAWPAEHRAAGGLVDGDASGALAGFWSSVFLVLAPSSVVGLLTATAGSAIAWGALWLSGSRMALLAGAIGVAFTLAFGLRVRQWRSKVVVVLVVTGIVAALAAAGNVRWSSASPLRRTLETLPTMSRESLAEFAKNELFDRHAPYGSASVLMLKQFPVTGVGVGGFYQMFPDYSYVITGARAAFENAQSWYRHQLAELGLVGSLGWLWWVGSFGWLLVTTGGDSRTQLSAGILKGTLVAMALVSAVSMPTQVIPVALTVWVFAFWYLSLSTTAQYRLRANHWSFRRTAWLIVWLVAAGFVLDTLWVARTALRPPYRALLADWRYERGFYTLEEPPGTEAFRWSSDNAVSVFPSRGRYLKLTFWVYHPDVATRPVDVKIWRRDKRIVTATLHNTTPMTWYVRAPADGPRMMLEILVSRTWRPSDYGQKDVRELGLAVADWKFVDEPPRDAPVIN